MEGTDAKRITREFSGPCPIWYFLTHALGVKMPEVRARFKLTQIGTLRVDSPLFSNGFINSQDAVKEIMKRVKE